MEEMSGPLEQDLPKVQIRNTMVELPPVCDGI
jgi:hypothetical protein